MFNQGNNGLDLINHAIRMGTVEEVLRRNQLLRQLNNGNPSLAPLPSVHPVQTQPGGVAQVLSQAPPQQAPAARPATERMNPNAFQFPWKLHDMLDNAVADGFSTVVSWQEDGRSFRVHKPQEFVDSVMPIYFKQTKYKSFQRQLNLYGFSRINEGPSKGGYRHQFFIRGQRQLCQLISRNPVSEPTSSTDHSTNSTQGVALASQSSPEEITHESKPSSNHHPPLDQVVHEHANVTTNATTAPAHPADVATPSPSTAHIPQSTNDSSNYRHRSNSVASSTDERNDDYRSNREFQFPWKLYEMLEKSESNSFEYIVSWQPDGTSFRVHDTNKFVDTIMPQFFKQTKYKSFQRQLNLYGFSRVDEGPNKGSYKHPLFSKGQKDLLSSLNRQKMRNEKLGSPGSLKSSGETFHEYVPETPNSQSEYASLHSHPSRPPSTSDAKEMGQRASEGDATKTIAGKEEKELNVSNSAAHSSSQQNVPVEGVGDWVIEVVDNTSGQNRSYNVHRHVLAMGPRRSDFFATQCENMRYSHKCLLELPPEEASVFPLLLEHIYLGSELPLNTNTAFALYSVADRLEVSSLIHLITDFYFKLMNKDNVFDFIALSQNFHDKTLLETAISKCAEELRSMDQTLVSRLQPDVLLQVVQKSKTLRRNYKCGSTRLSQFVAECAQLHLNTLTKNSFYMLTDKEHLPCIEPVAAIKLLATEKKLLAREVVGPPPAESSSLQERCVDAIANNWNKLRNDVEESPLLSSNMKEIGSELLFEILLKATESSEVSV